MSRRNNKQNARHVEPPSDDDSVNDNQSQLSLDQHHNDGSSGADHHSADERDDEKLLIALEDATEKSVQKRTAALQAVVDELSHRYLADCVEDRKCTMMDLIERTLRRGKGAEQTLGAQLVPLLVLQLGDADIVGRALAPLLLQTAQNAAVSYGARAKCCEALALLAVLSGSDAGDAMQTMQSMESIFAPAYVKSAPGQTSGAAAGAANDASLLHCAALNAWALLLTLCPAGDLCSMVNRGGVPGFPSIKNLLSLLHSPHLDVRLAAGETIALLLETGRRHDGDFLDDHLPEMIDVTRLLATDSQKFRAKRDRKTQRATFRDVLRYVEEDEQPETTVRFGSDGEKLKLVSWSDHAMYAALLTACGPGMTVHLMRNDFVRDVLDLGPRRLETARLDTKQNKQQRHLMNAAAFKERTKQRNGERNVKIHF